MRVSNANTYTGVPAANIEARATGKLVARKPDQVDCTLTFAMLLEMLTRWANKRPCTDSVSVVSVEGVVQTGR
jgi:hypothetical protein